MTTARSQAPNEAATSRRKSPAAPSQRRGQASKPSSDQISTTPAESDVHYTVFVRLPFPRSDFQEPPQVQWDFSKDKQLWKLISKVPNSKQLNWKQVSERLEAPLDFVLQQAAWLYERHFEEMKAQMKMIGGRDESRIPSSPIIDPGATESARDGAVQDVDKQYKRPSTAIHTQQRTTPAVELSDEPNTPRALRPPVSRIPSTSTVRQSHVIVSSGRQPSKASPGSGDQHTTPFRVSDETRTHEFDNHSDSNSEAELSAPSRAQATRKQHTTTNLTQTNISSAEDDDAGNASAEGYLPFAARPDSRENIRSTAQTGSANVTIDANDPVRPRSSRQQQVKQLKQPHSPQFESSASTTSSTQPHGPNTTAPYNRPGPPNPKHRAESKKPSPGYKNPGSDDARSMGSSFSDLDTSLTQSALEDALMSNMKDGSIGMGSRMSNIP